jgi:two-component system response regulator PilR (NtrC family)
VPRPEISDAALDRLLSYSFPGNVRELENILERAVTLCSDGRVEPGDIQLKNGAGVELPEVDDDAVADAGLEGQLEHIEREAIIKALEQTRYNKTKAAELLGMTFRQLRYRVKKLGID